MFTGKAHSTKAVKSRGRTPIERANSNNELAIPQSFLSTAFNVKRSILFASVGFIIGDLILDSKVLALLLSLVGGLFPSLLQRRQAEQERKHLGKIWPELLDHMISGLRSGLSIAETLSGLAMRGPELSRPIFKQCHLLLISGHDIEYVFDFIKSTFDDPVADQVCEVLNFARGTGSRDTAITLRTLGDFIRSDIAVRGEIHAKLGWVKNSALVATVAPWILLLILSTQPSTAQAFATSTGILILISGVFMSGLAYFWMSRVGRVQEIPRIFTSLEHR